MPLDPMLLEILACPECRAKVEVEQEGLRCPRCGRRYRVEDDIPIMLLEEAEPPPPDWLPRDG
jgi:hypothetical protein